MMRVTDPNQLHDLEVRSAISRDIIARAHLETIADAKFASKLVGRPVKAWSDNAEAVLPALRFPYYAPGQAQASVASSLKLRGPWPREEKEASGKGQTYLRPKGFNRVYLTPDLVERPELLADASVPKLVIEGEKKALCAASYGVCAVAISGVDCWGPKATGRARKRLHEELATIARAGGDIYLCPDADQSTNWHVASSMGRKLANELVAAGGHVFLVRLPEHGPKGLDDVLAALAPVDRVAGLALILSKAKEAGEHVVDDGAGGRVLVSIGDDEKRVADEVVDALASAGDRIGLFKRGPALARVARTDSLPRGLTTRESGSPTIEIIHKATLREFISEAVRFEVPGSDAEEVPRIAHPPEWCVLGIYSRGGWEGIRHLAHVSEVPLLAPDGRIVQLPGYDVETGIYYQPRGSFPSIPERPSAEQVAAARAALEEVVCDYHFEKPAHRSAWFAFVLTMFSRFAFHGAAPLFLIDANTAGTGKSLLVDVAALIATGRTAATSSFTDDEEEMSKRIVTWAMGGVSLIALDNIAGTLGGAELCRAVTSCRVAGRILGGNIEWKGDINATWCATGNNTQLGVDMHRRVAHVRVLADDESPESRSGFRHPDLRAWTRENHPRLAVAALTLLRAAFLAERPQMQTWGGFEGWTGTVRAAIVGAGWADPSDAREELAAFAMGDRPAHQRVLISRWDGLCKKLSAQSITTKRAIKALFPDGGDDTIDPELRDAVQSLCGEKVTAHRLGTVMREMRSKVVGGKALLATIDRNGVSSWSVVGSGAVLAPMEPQVEEWVV